VRREGQGVPLALSSGSLYTYGLARVFELAKWAGFDGIEVLVDQRWDTRHGHYLRRLQEEHGLPVVSLHTPFSGKQVDGWERDEITRLKHTVALAEELEARTVVVHPPLRWHWMTVLTTGGKKWRIPLFLRNGQDHLRWLLEELADFQTSTPVTIAVENMPIKRWGRWRLRHFSLSDLTSLERFPNLTLDTTHLGTWGWDVLEVYERLKARVVHVHVSDYNAQEPRKEHRLPGEGSLPLAELLRRLVSDDFAGVVTIELDPGPLEAGDEAAVRAHLRNICNLCWQQGIGLQPFA